MSKSAKEITSENFSAAVNSAYALTKKLHSAVLALKIILPLGSILLALHAMILFLGILGTVVYNNPETLIVFRALPFISEYWNSVWGTVSSITELLYLRIIILVAILFLVSFAICSIAMLIIFCFTKAETCVIEGNTAKKPNSFTTIWTEHPGHILLHLKARLQSGAEFAESLQVF